MKDITDEEEAVELLPTSRAPSGRKNRPQQARIVRIRPSAWYTSPTVRRRVMRGCAVCIVAVIICWCVISSGPTSAQKGDQETINPSHSYNNSHASKNNDREHSDNNKTTRSADKINTKKPQENPVSHEKTQQKQQQQKTDRSPKQEPTPPTQNEPDTAWSPPFTLSCPALHDETDGDSQLYIDEDQQASNITEYLQNFRTMNFDQWGKTYNHIKKKLTNYKQKAMKSLKSGDAIFESACGVGLNLVMTAEILQEAYGIQDLVVYGNEYVKESTQLANRLMDNGILEQSGAHKGSICQGDSLNLSFVPTSTFDLVYTGYLTPMYDPLGWQTQPDPENFPKGKSEDDVYEYYYQICDQQVENHETLRKTWRLKQEAWYDQWVGEMIRIAKPEAAVIVEQASEDLCDYRHDWDGVPRSYWERKVEEWGTVEDLQMETNEIDRNRYNVYMRKKAQSSQRRLLMTCPKKYDKAADLVEAPEYEKMDKAIIQNVDKYANTFRTTKFDAWGRTYNEFKSTMRDWISRRFAPLRSGDSIYESASGLGLNLLLTLEILEEDHNVTNITIYGNDFVKESVEISNQLMDHRNVLPSTDWKGSLCQGDSSDLNFVGDNLFDLVFTGYITPKFDVLGLEQPDDSDDDIYGYYKDICNSDSEESTRQRDKWVALQEKWYRTWVGEMVRIAKPGAPIIIEHVSQPYCSYNHDWDGVDRSFFTEAVTSNAWDVDPSSLELETAFDENRYHVFMRKNVK